MNNLQWLRVNGIISLSWRQSNPPPNHFIDVIDCDSQFIPLVFEIHARWLAGSQPSTLSCVSYLSTWFWASPGSLRKDSTNELTCAQGENPEIAMEIPLQLIPFGMVYHSFCHTGWCWETITWTRIFGERFPRKQDGIHQDDQKGGMPINLHFTIVTWRGITLNYGGFDVILVWLWVDLFWWIDFLWGGWFESCCRLWSVILTTLIFNASGCHRVQSINKILSFLTSRSSLLWTLVTRESVDVFFHWYKIPWYQTGKPSHNFWGANKRIPPKREVGSQNHHQTQNRRL